MKKTGVQKANEVFNGFLQDLQTPSRKRIWELESQKGEFVQIYVGFEDEEQWISDDIISIDKRHICDYLGVVYYYDKENGYLIRGFMPRFDPVNGYREMKMDYPIIEHEFDNEDLEDFIISKGILDKGVYEC